MTQLTFWEITPGVVLHVLYLLLDQASAELLGPLRLALSAIRI